MRYLLVILIVLTFTGCEQNEPKSDPFIGVWHYDKLNVRFTISRNDEFYTISDLTVNNEIWHRKELSDIKLKENIGTVILSRSVTSNEGIVLFACHPNVNGGVLADSVWQLYGTPQVKTVSYNQSITVSSDF